MSFPALRHALFSTLVAPALVVTGCGDESGEGGEGTGAGATSKAASSGASNATTGSSSGDGGGGQSNNGDGNYTISPPYEPAPEVIPNDQVPQGVVTTFTMSSSDSAIYPTDVTTGEVFTRDVAVYIPQQYAPGTEAPFMVVQDGINFYQSTMVPALDNMIAAGDLPVMIAIFVEPGPNLSETEGERSFEYDSVTATYGDFVEQELLPRVVADFGVVLTEDPEGRAAMGGSSGGAAAFTMGWFHTDKYHRILTYSGSFCALQTSAMYRNGAWDYHASIVPSSPTKPLRVFLSASELDYDLGTPTTHWLTANENMADALAAKGYHYRYVYAEGAGHIDFAVLQATLPDTLRWLWQGYPVN